MSAPVLMSRQRRAGCFLPAAAARRPAVTGGGGASKMAAAAIGGVSEQKIQDFLPGLRRLSPVRQWLDYLTVISPPHSIIFIVHAEFVIVNGVML